MDGDGRARRAAGFAARRNAAAASFIRCWAAVCRLRRTSRSSSRNLAANRPAMLGDHKIQGRVVVPGAAYLEMALAASAVAHGKPWTLCAANLIEPLVLDKSPTTVQTILTPEAPARRRSIS